jgi:methylglutaconyl-CoA hydratase
VQVGLITRAVAGDELDAETERYVGMLLRGAPEALAATKDVLAVGPSGTVAHGLAEMSALSATFFGSDEAREGMAAFAAKRDPAWVPARQES